MKAIIAHSAEQRWTEKGARNDIYESRANKEILQIKTSDVRVCKRIGLLQNYRLCKSIIFSEGIYKQQNKLQRRWGEMIYLSTDEVARILSELFGDECACNYCGIDEWLPTVCKYADTECPKPKEKHGCWKQFLRQHSER